MDFLSENGSDRFIQTNRKPVESGQTSRSEAVFCKIEGAVFIIPKHQLLTLPSQFRMALADFWERLKIYGQKKSPTDPYMVSGITMRESQDLFESFSCIFEGAVSKF